MNETKALPNFRKLNNRMQIISLTPICLGLLFAAVTQGKKMEVILPTPFFVSALLVATWMAYLRIGIKCPECGAPLKLKKNTEKGINATKYNCSGCSTIWDTKCEWEE